MLDLYNNVLSFSLPDVHPEAKMKISLQRTLRIPDDGKAYPLPPDLGHFPLRRVDDFKDRVPAKWLEHGGIMTALYQSEALWMRFSGHQVQYQGVYPFAVKIAAGKVSAVTGERWSAGLTPKDYVTVPKQPWIDGYVVEKGLVRQFVAAPLGLGVTAEEQITGEAEFGGIQIEVIPMKSEVFNRRFPRVVPQPRIMRSTSLGGDMWEGKSSGGIRPMSATNADTRRRGMRSRSETKGADAIRSVCDSDEEVFGAAAADMGMAAGGQMKQEIYADPFDISDWDTQNTQRVFIHLANSLVWKAVTQQDPPSPPQTAADYARYGLPWFDTYKDDLHALQGTDKLKGVMSMLKYGMQKGLNLLPENESIDLNKLDQVTHMVGTPHQVKLVGPNTIREGKW